MNKQTMHAGTKTGSGRRAALFAAQGAMVAALYVALTWIASIAGLSSMAIQVRISEALCVLPFFLPAAVPGRHRHAAVLNVLIPLPTVVANTVIVPLILHYAYGLPDALPYLFLTVGLGEVLSAWVLGLLLLRVLKKVLPGIHRRQS